MEKLKKEEIKREFNENVNKIVRATKNMRNQCNVEEG